MSNYIRATEEDFGETTEVNSEVLERKNAELIYYLGGDSPDTIVEIACDIDDKVLEQQIGFSDKYTYTSYAEVVGQYSDWYSGSKDRTKMLEDLEGMLMEDDLHTASPTVLLNLLTLQFKENR